MTKKIKTDRVETFVAWNGEGLYKIAVHVFQCEKCQCEFYGDAHMIYDNNQNFPRYCPYCGAKFMGLKGEEEGESFFIRGREFLVDEIVRRTTDEDCWHVEVPQI